MSLRLSTVLVLSCAAGISGGAFVWLFQGHSIKIRPEGMTYAELAAVLLAAASVMVAVFGVSMAVLALWGYRQFKRVAKGASSDIAREVASKEVLNELREGAAGNLIDQKVLEAMDEVLSSGKFDAWREEREAERKRHTDLDKEEGHV